MKVSKLTLLAALMLFGSSACLNAGNGEGEACERQGRGGKGGHEGMERGRRSVHGRMMKNLDLTEDQKEQMKGLHEKNKEQGKELGKAVGEAQKALRAAAEGDDINEAKIRELSKNLADAMAAMTIHKVQMKKDVDAILTDEQKVKMEEKKAEMKKKREERRAKMKERMEKRKGKKDCDGNNDRRKRDCDGDHDEKHGK